MKVATPSDLAFTMILLVGCSKPSADSTASSAPTESQGATSSTGQIVPRKQTATNEQPSSVPTTGLPAKPAAVTSSKKGLSGTAKKPVYSLVGKWEQVSGHPPGTEIVFDYKSDGSLTGRVDSHQSVSKFTMTIATTWKYKVEGNKLTQQPTGIFFSSDDPAQKVTADMQNKAAAKNMHASKPVISTLTWKDRNDVNLSPESANGGRAPGIDLKRFSS